MIDNKVEEIKNHIEAISEILGFEKTDSNENTPLRVAKMYCNELFKNRNNNNIEELNSQMKLFNYTPCGNVQPITMRDIEFHSTCEHHWLPFMGVAEISYIPSDKIIGLSKIPRVVKYFSQKPQLQEKLTNEIGEYLFNLLKPQWISVKLTATHTCVMCRGAESNCSTDTIYTRAKSLANGFRVDVTDFIGGTPV